MLLDEDKNANFHTTLLLGSKTGLDSILKFFQCIIRDEIMDNIEKDANLRNSAITKQDWIRFYQMKAQDSAQVL